MIPMKWPEKIRNEKVGCSIHLSGTIQINNLANLKRVGFFVSEAGARADVRRFTRCPRPVKNPKSSWRDVFVITAWQIHCERSGQSKQSLRFDQYHLQLNQNPRFSASAELPWEFLAQPAFVAWMPDSPARPGPNTWGPQVIERTNIRAPAP